MKEIILSDEIRNADGFMAAYRMGTVDMYATLGMNQEAVAWLWIDLRDNQAGI